LQIIEHIGSDLLLKSGRFFAVLSEVFIFAILVAGDRAALFQHVREFLRLGRRLEAGAQKFSPSEGCRRSSLSDAERALPCQAPLPSIQ
jgi:hypothetical protein